MPRAVRYVAPKCVQFDTPELQSLLKNMQTHEFTINKGNGSPEVPDWLKKTEIKIGETEYTVGIGGLHSKEKKMVVEPAEDEVLRNIDVASYYPSMILEFGFYPKRFTRKFFDIYGEIKRVRLKAKREGDKVVNDIRDQDLY